MTSTDAPLLLLHGALMSKTAWDEVIPELGERREVIALTAVGHRGGQPPSRRPARIEHLVDAAEQHLDALGHARVHIAGNSLGGWMGIELARRGRALTVCAFSPAGFWDTGTPSYRDATDRLRREVTLARIGGPFGGVAVRVAYLRHHLLSTIARHGERVSAARAAQIIGDLKGCSIAADLLSTDEQIAPMPTLPCPITLAWSARDRLFPPTVNGAIARSRLPDARFLILDGVGHVPMIDDPALVAATILDSVETADSVENG